MSPSRWTSRHWQQSLDLAPVWLSGAMLSVALLMIVALVGLIMGRGFSALWPVPLWQITLKNGSSHLGLIHATEFIPQTGDSVKKPLRRTLFRIGNRDLYGNDFVWIDDDQVISRMHPADVVIIERLEWGPFYGFLKQMRIRGEAIERQGPQLWTVLQQQLPRARRRYRAIQHLQRRTIGDISAAMEQHRLALRRL